MASFDEDAPPPEPMKACSMCRQEVPARMIMILMTREVCLNCAASFFDDEDSDND
jgi:hypothetical protein